VQVPAALARQPQELAGMSFLVDQTAVSAVERKITAEIGDMARIIYEACLVPTVRAIPGDKVVQRYHITTSAPKKIILSNPKLLA
jgi:hypothetical protein